MLLGKVRRSLGSYSLRFAQCVLTRDDRRMPLLRLSNCKLAGRTIQLRGLLIHLGQIAALEQGVAMRLFGNSIENAPRFGVVMRRLGRRTAQAQSLAQQEMTLSQRHLQSQLLAVSQATL